MDRGNEVGKLKTQAGLMNVRAITMKRGKLSINLRVSHACMLPHHNVLI